MGGLLERHRQASATYIIEVSTASDGYNSYKIRRRYRQFDTLHAALKDSFRGVPELPGKGGLLKGKDFLDKRKEGLNTYLNKVVEDPALIANEDVRRCHSAPARGPKRPHPRPHPPSCMAELGAATAPAASQVRTFLELSSAEQLLHKIHEKEIQFTTLVLSKDQASHRPAARPPPPLANPAAAFHKPWS